MLCSTCLSATAQSRPRPRRYHSRTSAYSSLSSAPCASITNLMLTLIAVLWNPSRRAGRQSQPLEQTQHCDTAAQPTLERAIYHHRQQANNQRQTPSFHQLSKIVIILFIIIISLSPPRRPTTNENESYNALRRASACATECRPNSPRATESEHRLFLPTLLLSSGPSLYCAFVSACSVMERGREAEREMGEFGVVL